jgi:hypothetical protein
VILLASLAFIFSQFRDEYIVVNTLNSTAVTLH